MTSSVSENASKKHSPFSGYQAVTMNRILAWLEYLPRGIRKAWCEITGGHRDNLLTATKKPGADVIVTHIKLNCGRCGRETIWHATAPEHKGL